jgi:hypothetical protein
MKDFDDIKMHGTTIKRNYLYTTSCTTSTDPEVLKKHEGEDGGILKHAVNANEMLSPLLQT